MEDSPLEVAVEGETTVIAAQDTPLGQSQLAYRLAAALMLVNSALGLLFALSASSAATNVIIPSALAIGLIELRRGARNLVLLVASLGVLWSIATGAMILLQGESSPIPFSTVGLQLAYTISVILCLTGRSSSRRLGLAVGIFVIGLLVAQPWTPVVGVISGQTADVLQVAYTVSVAAAIALLVIAVVAKHRAEESRAKSWAMGLLGITSVAALAFSSTFLRSGSQVVGAWIDTLIWAAVAAYVLVRNDRWRRALVTTAIILLVGFSILFVILSGLAG